MIVFSLSVSATLTADLQAYWSMETISGNNVADRVNDNNITKNGNVVVYTNNFMNGTQSINTSGLANNQFVTTPFNTGSEPFSIVGWIASEHSTYGGIISDYAFSTGWTFLTGATGVTLIVYDRLDAGCDYTSGTLTINNGSWYQVGLSYDGSSNLAVILNGDIITNISSCTLSNGDYGNLVLANYWDASQDRSYKGLYDEWAYYNRTLTTGEVTELYNNGVGRFYPFEEASPSPAGYLQITGKEIDGVTTINIFNATLNGTTYTTTNGTINTGIHNDTIINITAKAPGKYTETILNYNTAKNLQINFTTIGYLTITGKEINGITNVTTFNATINGTTYKTTNGTVNTDITNLTVVNIVAETTNKYIEFFNNYNTNNDLQINFTTIGYLNVTAMESDGVTPINIFNATLNGTTYKTTNGTINTALNDRTITNITSRTANHFTINTYNYNTSYSNLQVNFSKYAYLTAHNTWNGSLIKGFWIVTGGNTYVPATHPTLNDGYIYIDDNATQNVIYYDPNEEYIYGNMSKFHLNLSPDSIHNVSLSMSNTTLRAYEKVTGSLITTAWNLTNELGQVYNSSSGILTFYPNFNNYSWNFTFNNYYNRSNVAVEITPENSANNTFNLTGLTNFELVINPLNLWNGSNIGNFYINITDNNGYGFSNTSIFSGLNGSINLTQGVNYTVIIGKTGYIPKTITIYGNKSFELSSNSLYMSNTTLRAYEKVTGSLITTAWNLTNELGQVYNSSSGILTFYPNFNNYSWNFTFNNYYNRSNVAVEVTTINGNLNLTEMYNYKLTIKPKDIFSNALLGNFSINLTDNNSYSFNEYFNTSITNITFNLTKNVNYTFITDPIDYAPNTTFMINNSAFTRTFNVYLYKENSVYIRVFDEEKDSILNWETVNIEFIGTNLSRSNTTTTGTLLVEPLVAGDYRIRYSANSYPERVYFTTVVAGDTQIVNIYLLNYTKVTNITVVVYDQASNLVEGAYIKLLRYYIADNVYKTVEMGLTNFEGETGLLAEFNSEFYKFIVEYDDTIYIHTVPFKITSTTLTFTISLGLVDPFINLKRLQDVAYSLTYNNNTHNFAFTFSDTNNVVSQGCLYVYNEKIVSSTLYNSTCVNSTGATILINIPVINGTSYKAEAKINFGSGLYHVDTLYQSFNAGKQVFGNVGLFLTIFLIIIMSFIAIWNPNISIMMIAVTLIFTTAIGFITIGTTAIMGIIGVIIIIMLQNKA